MLVVTVTINGVTWPLADDCQALGHKSGLATTQPSDGDLVDPEALGALSLVSEAS